MGRRCMKQNRKDGPPGRSHRIKGRPPAGPTALEGEGDAADRQPRYTEAMTERATEIMQKALSLSEEELADLDSGRAKTVSWEEVRGRISSKLPHGKQGS